MKPATGNFATPKFDLDFQGAIGIDYAQTERIGFPVPHKPSYTAETGERHQIRQEGPSPQFFPSTSLPALTPWAGPLPFTDTASTTYSLVSVPVSTSEIPIEGQYDANTPVLLERIPVTLFPPLPMPVRTLNAPTSAQNGLFPLPNMTNSMIQHHPAFGKPLRDTAHSHQPSTVAVPEVPARDPPTRFYTPTEQKDPFYKNGPIQNPSTDLPAQRFQFAVPPPTYQQSLESQKDEQNTKTVHRMANESKKIFPAPPPTYEQATPSSPNYAQITHPESPIRAFSPAAKPPSTPGTKTTDIAPSQPPYNMSPYHPTWSPNVTPMTSPMSIARGVENPQGENHCFLNVLIQSLYRLANFREKFLSITHIHSHSTSVGNGSTEDTCVLCSLQTIWNAYKQLDIVGALDPSGVRTALGQLDNAFARWKQADAGESLLRILSHLHDQLTEIQVKSMVGNGVLAQTGEALALSMCSSDVTTRCLIHEYFAWETQTITRCPRCEDDVKSDMGWTLLVEGKRLKKDWSFLNPTRLGKLVSDPSNLAETLVSCPNERCSEKHAKRNVVLIAAPPIFQISVTWPWDPSEQDPAFVKRTASDVLEVIGSTLRIKDMFASATKSNIEYQLQGFVAYYGLHYVAYQLVRRSNESYVWHHFDDAKVHELRSWEECKESVHKGGFLPVLLWYVRKPSPTK